MARVIRRVLTAMFSFYEEQYGTKSVRFARRYPLSYELHRQAMKAQEEEEPQRDFWTQTRADRRRDKEQRAWEERYRP